MFTFTMFTFSCLIKIHKIYYLLIYFYAYNDTVIFNKTPTILVSVIENLQNSN